MQPDEPYTERQVRVIAEIQRVAQELGTDRLSQDEFDRHHCLAGCSTAGYQFGSWNRAVEAAGLKPYPPGGSDRGPRIDDLELLQEIIRLQKQFGKPPTERLMASHGKFSPKPYKSRWGSLEAAKEAAYAAFGQPA